MVETPRSPFEKEVGHFNTLVMAASLPETMLSVFGTIMVKCIKAIPLNIMCS